ncbi:MAG: HepT-like ribonuclease domain-containing protein [Nanoarchaeota archaeon]
MKEDKIFVEHILDSINAIEGFVKNVNEEELYYNRMMKSAIIREIEIIGEAAKNISNEFKNKHKGIPWKDIMGTRDKLIHHYFGIDFKIVWKIIKLFLPELKNKLENLN